MQTITRLIAIATLTMALTGPAFAFCSEPSAPYCASGYSDFTDQYEFDRCKRDMESYRDEVESFIQCSQREIDDLSRKASNASDEYNSAVSSFNRRTP